MKTKLFLVAVAFSVFGLTSCKSNKTKGNSEESSIDTSIEVSELFDETEDFDEDELSYSNIVTAIDSPDVETPDVETPEEEEEDIDYDDEE